MNSAAIAVAFDGRVLFSSGGAERLYCVAAEEMLGHPVSTCYRCENVQGDDEQATRATMNGGS